MASLNDAYELGGIAGHGRTTLIRLGVRRGDARPVALKLLRDELSQDPTKRHRFMLQIRRARLLEHHNIESMLDLIEGDSGPVAVAEWIDGRSLRKLLRWRRATQHPWSVDEVALIVRELLCALRYAHHQPTDFDGQSMLHGGIDPRKVLLDVYGRVKLVGFGMDLVWQETTEPWQDLETLRYLSADQMRHGPTPNSDLHGVGALMHEMLTGRRFRDNCQDETQMRATINAPAPPATPDRDDIPPALERLRTRLLEPVPNPRITFEHLLDLCDESQSTTYDRSSLGLLVREALRNDRTPPSSESAMGQTSGSRDPSTEDTAKVRSRSRAAKHDAVDPSPQLAQAPLGNTEGPRPRDTQSVPVPVLHEQTASRAPLFLKQTAPPQGEQTRSAEHRRSGSEHAGPTPSSPSTHASTPARPKSPDEYDSDETAVIHKIARLPEDQALQPDNEAPPLSDRANPATPAGGVMPSPSSLHRRQSLFIITFGILGLGSGLFAWRRCPSSTDGKPTDR